MLVILYAVVRESRVACCPHVLRVALKKLVGVKRCENTGKVPSFSGCFHRKETKEFRREVGGVSQQTNLKIPIRTRLRTLRSSITLRYALRAYPSLTIVFCLRLIYKRLKRGMSSTSGLPVSLARSPDRVENGGCSGRSETMELDRC